VRTACIALAGVLAACAAPPPQTRAPLRPPARVDMSRAAAQHPFAKVLAQYDRDIATLQASRFRAAFGDFDRRLHAGATAVARAARLATTAQQGLRPRTSAAPAAREAGGPDSLGESTLASFQTALDERIQRALQLRGQQLREDEANVALAFERAHAGTRLQLTLKLSDLHLDAPTRKNYLRRLNALDDTEAAVVNARRRQDAATLAIYAARLHAQAAAGVATLADELDRHRRAAASIRAPEGTALPAALVGDDRAAAAAAFRALSQDAGERANELRASNDTAQAGLSAEIARLTNERDRLHAEMIADIETRAREIASARGLGRLYTGAAPADARDLTAAVVRDLQTDDRLTAAGAAP
jgi:hypothetical protein